MAKPIKLRIVDSGDKLKTMRQRIIGDIMKAKIKAEENRLQKQLAQINKKIRGR